MANAGIVNSAFSAAQVAHQAGRIEEARRSYKRVLDSNPHHAETWHMLGVANGQLGDASSAVQCINKAIEIEPRNPAALYNLGCVLHGAGATRDAILAFTRAVGLDATHSAAWNNLGAAFLDLNHYDSALKALEACISTSALYEPAHDNICRLHKRNDNFTECLQAADRGLKHVPDSWRLWIHRAEACFALGQFEDGWAAYEWRFKSSENPNPAPNYPIQSWKGESLANKSILIWTEQGPGETFLFSSLLADIISQAEQCIIGTTARLYPIMARSFPNAEVIDADQTPINSETADYQSSLISAGRWLRKSWKDFPEAKPLIKADPALINSYATAGPESAKPQPVVGIAWRSFGVSTADEKSVALDAWQPILSIPGIKFVSLQYGDVAQELAALKAATGVDIEERRDIDPVTDLDKHLAHVAGLDLVISSSNTTVHAAAAQGVPVWCLAHHTLGEGLRWPWFVGRSDSPWYSSLKLFRQDTRGDWALPIARVAIDLVKWRAEKVNDWNDTFSAKKYYLDLAMAYYDAGLMNAAVLAADSALAGGDNSVNAYRIAAKGHAQAGHQKLAIELLTEALKKNQDDINLLIDRASVHVSCDQTNAAEVDLMQALSLDPNSLEALNNLGRLKARQGFSQRALELFDQASKKAPDNFNIQVAAATRLHELGRKEEARKLFELVMQNETHAAEAGTQLAIGLLSDGELAEGWRLLRYRLSRPSTKLQYGFFPFQAWCGESVEGKNILVWTEQGIGDEILLATMMRDLSNQAKSVTLLCSSRLVPVLKRSLHGIRVAVRDEPLPKEAVDPKIDVQMSLSDVGQLLRPSFDTFPKSTAKPTLKADPKQMRKMRKQYLTSAPTSKLVGVSWHSSTLDFGQAKSIPPDLFKDLIVDIPAQFVSLQYDAQPNHIETLRAANPTRWTSDPDVDPLTDMDAAAAQVAAMDFVVTVSNTTAHTSGGLGIPTILLIPPQGGRHWYWHRGQARSSWYPSVTIFEADKPQDWASALKRAARHLKELIDQA